MTPEDLKAWRERLGLSQEDVSKALPVPVRTWQRWEWGESSPPGYLLRALRDLEREVAEDWHGPRKLQREGER